MVESSAQACPAPQFFLPAGARLCGGSREWPEGASEGPEADSSFTLSKTVFLMEAGDTFSWSAMDCSSLRRHAEGWARGRASLLSPTVHRGGGSARRRPGAAGRHTHLGASAPTVPSASHPSPRRPSASPAPPSDQLGVAG